MRVDILSLFPEMFLSPFDQSIISRARQRGLLDIAVHNIRDYALDKHHVVDDYSYGGGPGMVLKPEPVFAAAEAVKKEIGLEEVPVIFLTPRGRLFNQRVAGEIALFPNVILICGRYEGVDERVCQYLATDEISIGDYVLSGGEIAAMVVVDAVARLIPGVLGSAESLNMESHSDGRLLEYPQYTRPQVFREWSVPPVLLSGNHAEIACWREQQANLCTARLRPELLQKTFLSGEKEE